MAAQVLPVSGSAGGSFLDSPVFNGRRIKPPPSGFDLLDATTAANNKNNNYNSTNINLNNNTAPPIQTLTFEGSDLEDSVLPGVCTTYTFPYQADTPDSGFSGLAPSTPALKTPESDMSACGTPCGSSAGSGSGHRKRKTVTIDESQTSIVVISPDDLFNTYSRAQSHDHEDEDEEDEERFELLAPQEGVDDSLDHQGDGSVRVVLDSETGWPLKRSSSLESRDNPFLPGGDLSKEAEDLLSRATIIRDNFYLNQEEKKQLLEQQRLQQQQQEGGQGQAEPSKPPRPTKHVQIIDHNDSANNGHTAAVEERISPQTVSTAASAAPPVNGGDHPPAKENGKSGEPASSDSVHVTIPDGEGAANTPGDLQGQGSDKKRRNKCCAVM